MANEADVTIKLKAQDDASRVLNETSKSMTNMGANIQKQAAIVGAAFLAVGAAGLKMTADARKMNAELTSVGVTIGKTGAELRALALDLSNVTFKLNSVISSMSYLSRAGMEGTDAIGKTATAFDTLGDAIGMAGEATMKMLVPSFRMFNMDLYNATPTLDKFTYLVKNTTNELSDFNSMLSSNAQYMRNLGLTIDDLLVIMIAMDKEQGISASALSSTLSPAFSAAATTGADFYEMLGLNKEALGKYYEALAKSDGLMQQHADAMNSQYGIYDKVMQKLDDLKLEYGSILQPLEGLFAALTALAPILILFSVNATLAAGATRALGVAINFALGPIGWIIAAIGGIIIVVKLVIAHWDKIAAATKAVWNAISGFLKTILDGIIKGFNMFKDAALSIFEAIGKGILTNLIAPFWAMITLIEKVIEGIKKIPVIGSKIPGLGAITDMINGLQDWIGEHTYLPVLQHGGIVSRPTVALIGENGPEAVIPLGSAGAGGYGMVTIPIYLGGREIERYVVDLVTRSATVQGVRSRWT